MTMKSSIGIAIPIHNFTCAVSDRTNPQYLALQNEVQKESRQFTTLSNVMKTKHDTAKNAIQNIR